MEQGRLNWIANFWWVMPALSSEAFMSSRAALVGLSTASRRRCTVIGSILAKGILEAIDMDSYRVEKQAALKIQLPDADAQIEPVPTAGGGRKPEAELDRLSNILKTFNDQFGNVSWADADRVHKLITEDSEPRRRRSGIPNAKQNSDKQNARIEHDKALARVMTAVLKDDTELFKQFMDNESFKRWLTDTVFSLTYEQAQANP